MNSQRLKFVQKAFGTFLGLSLLVGCSSGAVESVQDKQDVVAAEAQAQVDQKVEAWGKFVGVDTETAQGLLSRPMQDETGNSFSLLDRIGKTSKLNEAEFKAFMAVTFKADGIFQNAVSLLNDEEVRTLRAINFGGGLTITATIADEKTTKGVFNSDLDNLDEVQKQELEKGVSKDIGATKGDGSEPNVIVVGGDKEDASQKDRENARLEYQKFSSLTTLLRNRAVAGAEILGFQLTPASMRDMLVDRNFLAVRDAFIEPIVKKLLDKDLEQATEQEKNSAAEPLASVSFLVDNQVLSFYEFISTDQGTKQPTSFGTKTVGRFFVRPAEGNILLLSIELTGSIHK